MKTLDYIERLVTVKRDEWIEEYRSNQEALKVIETIYGETCTGKPEDTITAFYDRIGKAKTDALIASLVNYSAWDGRISRTAKEWAMQVPGAFDEAAAARARIYTNRIHMSHLDQLARKIKSQIAT